MKTKKIILLLLMLLSLTLVACKSKAVVGPTNGPSEELTTEAVSQTNGLENVATSFLNQFMDGKFEDVYNNIDMDEAMKTSFTADVMTSVYSQLILNYGEFEST